MQFVPMPNIPAASRRIVQNFPMEPEQCRVPKFHQQGNEA